MPFPLVVPVPVDSVLVVSVLVEPVPEELVEAAACCSDVVEVSAALAADSSELWRYIAPPMPSAPTATREAALALTARARADPARGVGL